MRVPEGLKSSPSSVTQRVRTSRANASALAVLASCSASHQARLTVGTAVLRLSQPRERDSHVLQSHHFKDDRPPLLACVNVYD